MAITDSLKNIPTWAYAVGGVLIFGLVIMMTRGSGGSSSAQSTGLPAADVNDILSQLQDAANQLGSGSGSTGSGGSSGGGSTPPAGGTTSVKTLTGYNVVFKKGAAGRTALYDSKGKFVQYVSGFSTTAGLRKKIGGKWAYMITSGKYKGKYIITGIGKTVTLSSVYKVTQAPATTSTTTATVQQSNNAVA